MFHGTIATKTRELTMKIMSRNSASTLLPRTMFFAVILSFFFVSPELLAVTGQKTGVIDATSVLNQMHETKKAENILKATGTQWQKGLDNLKKSFQTSAASYEKQKSSLSKAAREQKEKDLNVKLQSIQKYQMDKFGPNGALEKKKAELLAPIHQKLLAAVKAVAVKEGFSVIIDKQAMIYGSSSADITAKVINQLK
ncbi:MAG: OmpH family outer membrane protein [Chlorobium phaeobacteroides]|nr:OmpH family outer membrane protein [Chlorobium phaeobacteroides]